MIMIHIERLFKSFGKLDVLQGIDLAFDRPGVSAILGPNGSGKTTLIKSILGMVLPDAGTITLDGRPIRGQWAYRDGIGYLPQIARFPENLTVAELLAFIRDLRGRPGGAEPLLERFGLHPFLNKRLGYLSGGTRQKVNIVTAFMFDCPLLILDEPTSGLDPIALITLKQLIREERASGKTILVTTHLMDFVEEMADEIVFLLEGKIHFRGKTDVLKQQTHTRKLDEAIAAVLRGELHQRVNGSRQPVPGPRVGGVPLFSNDRP